MKKQKIYFLLDEVLLEYENHFEKKSEKQFIKDLSEYLPILSKTSEIILITKQEIDKVNKWLLENNLHEFVYNVSNPVM